MRKLVLLFLMTVLPFVIWGQTSKEPLYREGQVIVKFKAGPNKARGTKTDNSVNKALQLIGGTNAKQLMPLTGSLPAKSRGGNGENSTDYQGLSGLYVLQFDKKQSVENTVEKLKKLGDVQYAEPNYIVRAVGYPSAAPLPQPEVNEVNSTPTFNDPKYSEQWGLQAINMPALWEKPVINSKRPVIAILDTGVDITHPDLAANIWTNAAEKGNDEDGNGFVGDVHGWDFVENTSDITDKNNHGTHCAGIAAAVGNNGVGIVGANPNALIMPVRVLDEIGEGDVTTVLQGIDYAIAHGADVLSMSYGYQCPFGPSEAERDALLDASRHAVLVAATGNSGVCMNPAHQGLHGNPDAYPAPSYPAAFTFVIGIQASDETGKLASYSNFDCGITPPAHLAPDMISLSYELTAPGDNLLSTVSGGGYEKMSGTSMACPLVAGAISSLLQRRSFNSNQELLTTLAMTSQIGNVDMAAAYGITELPQHQINEIFTANVEGVDITFRVKTTTTVQVGDGENAAINQDMKNVTIPKQVDGFLVTSIGRRAFAWTELETISLPNSIKYFDNEAFSVASQLKSIDIPESVTEIGRDAFSNSGLESVYIPANVQVIGDVAFCYCDNLQSIVVDKNNPIYDSRDNCNAIIETASNMMIVGTSVIPDGIEIIGMGAFARRQMETIKIPNTVKVIGWNAFGLCKNLKEIDIPESVTTIDVAAFEDCLSLTSVYIPKSVTYMWTPFLGCQNLTSVIIDPANPVYDSRDNCNAIIKTATNSLLWGYNCTHIPDGITSIGTEGASAFARCEKLEAVTITKDITFIGECIFISCNNLNSIVVVDDNPVYDSRDNCNAIIETATNTLIFGNHASTIPSSIKVIGRNAFQGTDYDANTPIVFPEGLERIRENAYLGLNNVTLTLPSTIREIENNAFFVFNEGQIAEVYCYRKTPLDISNYVFRAVSTATLHVPKGQKAAYEKAKGWKRFGTIVEMDVEGADPPIEIEPIVESSETTFGGEESIIDEETDLSNVVIENTYYTMNAENGDGYDADKQALVLNTTTTKEQMNVVQNAEVGDDKVRDNYSGIIFEVPAGKGTINMDVQTIGAHALNVQIGKGEPTKVTKPEREPIDIKYKVSEPTYVYIYASTSDGKALTRAAAENCVLLYGYSVTLAEKPKGDVNGDGEVDEADLELVVNYILKPFEDFNKDAADMNGDGKVNAADVVLIINAMTNPE